MSKTIITWLVALLLIATSMELIAQEVSSVISGDHIRVTFLKSVTVMRGETIIQRPEVDKKLVGTLVRLEADTLVLREKGQSILSSLSIASLTRLEVSRDRKSRTGRGALIGFLVGAGVGAVGTEAVCANARDFDSGSVGAPDIGTCLLLGGVAFGLIGTGIGAIAGKVIKGERWERVSIDKLRMSDVRKVK